MANASDASFQSTFTITSGKWYWEALITSPATDYPYIGVATPYFDYQAVGGSCIRSSATGFFKASNATKWNLSSSSYGSSFSANDVMMIAYDADSGKIYFGKNGTWDASSNPATGANPAFTGVNAPVTPAGFVYNCSWSMNFGQRPFAYTPPSGFLSLCTTNLPASTVLKGSDYFGILTYTGTAPTPQTITGLDFQPDFSWVKSRGYNVEHVLADVLRGVTYTLSSNLGDAEYNGGTSNITAFNSNGITVGTADRVNRATSMVAWNWKANGAGVSNTAGSITSTVSANTTSGFSVVSWTGTGSTGTVGHGLGAAPSFIVAKRRNAVTNWQVYHRSLTANNQLCLNLTIASFSTTTWNNTEPTSGVFSIDNVELGANGATMIAYCFAPISGFSAFGSYTGNGSADGPFVYLGFRPRYILAKRTDSTGNWLIYDTTRDTFNGMDDELCADLSGAETTAAGIRWDALSNGIKMRNSGAGLNASGGTYIYACFAENPFKNALAR
jgi:hypothetical protein